ncbi:MAG: 3-deoxy-7-phosphoheptulonate synthase [Patescibacteria group bacterium]|jgi:3-deoxy-7-phosphoheptulonate synthase
MFVCMRPNATSDHVKRVQAEVLAAGFNKAIVTAGTEVSVVNCLGTVSHEQKLRLKDFFLSLPGVTDVELAKTPFRLTARQAHPDEFTVQINGISIGGNQPLVVMAGPCAVESLEQITASANAVKQAGAVVLRGGAYKPRTSPHLFQGLEERGLRFLAQARQETGLPIVTEVTSLENVALVAEHADILQIGTRNMQNFGLLRAVGRIDKPVILKRGMAATIDEWLQAAEYIVSEGNQRVILCARGIRTFDNGHTRNSADIDAIPVVKGLTHHPVIFDPSHTAGNRDLVPDIALAAVAAGADGLLIEVHPDPDSALCDGAQSLNPQQFAGLMIKVKAVANAIGRAA